MTPLLYGYNMSAQPRVVKSFFVVLRRGYPGLPWFHKTTLEKLGLHKRHQCVEKVNNASVRGMLAKVAHLIQIETDEMYYNRKMAEYEAAQPRPAVRVRHRPQPASTVAAQ